MRRLALHIASLLFLCAAQAQILSPMGEGLPAAPDKIANHNEGLVVAYDDRDNNINLQIWNGDFWYALPTPSLPATGKSDFGTYSIIDLLSTNDNIYLVAGYTTKLNSSANNSILKWDGNTWSNISDSKINSSLSLTSLFEEDGDIKCIGKFKDGTNESNVASYDGSTWSLEGNLITNNFEKDNFTSVVRNGKELYATGKFTNPQDNNLSLVKWNGTEWLLTSLPPFLAQNIALGTYQNKVVVYGKSNFNTAPIKISQGSNWTNLDSGLQNYTVNSISQFAELDGQLLALGSFTNTLTSENNKLMLYNGTTWEVSNITLDEIEQIHTTKNVVALSGNFDDNGILRGIGQVYADKAQVISRVYNDQNGNCKKDNGEEWMVNYPLKLNEIDVVTTGINGVAYAKIEKDAEYKINAASFSHYSPTCLDIELDAEVYKTYFTTAFGVKQELGVSDAKIYLTDNQGNKFVSGEEKQALLCISNLGSQPLTDAKVSLQLPIGLGNFSANIPADAIVDNIATWTIDLSAGTSECITLKYTLDGFDDLQLVANVKLGNNISDKDISNNESTFTYYSGESRPNSKHCLNGKIINPAEQHLRYKINIKNNNVASINGITIVDLLDEDIIVSHKGIAYTTSHGAYTARSRTEIEDVNGVKRIKLITTIEDISIPSSAINDELSKAFVDYEINIRSDLMKKDAEICNTAKIYLSFENGIYGEAITTNTVCSFMSETLGITNNTDLPSVLEDLEIGPNPVSDIILISNGRSDDMNIAILNSLGQDLQQIDVRKHSETSIDVSEYKAGVYFIYANGLFAKKIVIH